jgi:cellulose synthase/poly-beta-1,6-N-acetylglucosamine synthase-like glycosyltransferase
LPVLLISFLAALVIQLIFLLAFVNALKRRQDPVDSGNGESVSVIVCAHDEEQNLVELIPLLLKQDYPKFEVIIANDRSNDGTYDFLLAETMKDSRLRTVTIDRVPDYANGKKYALTLAIKAARHDVILLTDADCRPATDDWIRSMAGSFDSGVQIVVGYSAYFKHPGFLNLFIRYETLFTALHYVSLALLGKPYMGVGRNLAYRKALFLDNKGFDKNLGVTGGDDDLFVNAHATSGNVRVCVGPDSLVYSRPKTTWRGFLWQKVRHLSVGKRYKFSHRFLLGLFTTSQVLTWVLAVALLAAWHQPILVFFGIAARLIALYYAIRATAKRLGHGFELGYVPVLDFVFTIYYLSTGAVALVSKNLQWKKN